MVMDPRSPEVAMTVVLKAAWPALASEIDIRSEILHLAVGHGINVGAVGGDGHGPEIARGRDDRRLESRLASIGVGNRYRSRRNQRLQVGILGHRLNRRCADDRR